MMAVDSLHRTESNRSTSVIKLKAAVGDGVVAGGCCMAASDVLCRTSSCPAKGQAPAQLQLHLSHLVDQQEELSEPHRST